MEYSLKNHSFLLKNKNTLSKEEKSQLLAYDSHIEDQLVWKMRSKLELLFKNFLIKKIDGEFFTKSIHGLRRALLDQIAQFKSDLVSGKIENFQASESGAMNKLLSYLYFRSDQFEEDEYDTIEFYNFVQKGISALEDILKENTT